VEVVEDPAAYPYADRGSAITIGAYDGVHLGHRVVIDGVRRIAEAQGLASVVVTFDRHPAEVVRPESAPRVLTDLAQKLELLASTGVDATLVLHFDDRRAAEPAEEFVTEVLVGALGARVVSVGSDFHFGKGRGGSVALLEAMGRDHGFAVVPVELVAVPGTDGPVSSTRIRHLLTIGDVDTAATLLGREHEVRGVVVGGDRRGRELGFPTANVSVPHEILLPADGIYAGWYEDATGTTRATAISIGRRPTFYEAAQASLLEAHVLDFDGDLYDQPARVRFVRRLRGEERFDSVDDLVAQMRRDVDATRAALDGRDC
jgi:riboflavin kinase/FMN adenylyltransferase